MPPPPEPVFDLHCHPSLKYSILKNEQFSKEHKPASGPWGYISPLGVYYDAPGAVKGGVKVLVNAHYVPENGFRNSALLEFLQDIGVTDVIEDSDDHDSKGNPVENNSAWCKVKKSMYRLEEMVREANEQLPNLDVQIVTDPCSFDALRRRRKPGKSQLLIIHAIEGAHHLGRHLPGQYENDPAPYIDRLNQLKRCGFCVFTLSHFFLNDICDTAGGIPTSDYAVSAYKIPIKDKPGLTPIGERVVEWALRSGILLDLVHSTRETRKRVYQINRDLARSRSIPALKPLAFTHTGVRSLYRKGRDAAYESLAYLPDEEDMEAIRECKGIMGIILMKNWLNGIDDDEPIDTKPIFDTIDEIVAGTGGGFDYVGIGTDLDGFTHVPDNLNHCSKLAELSSMIMGNYKNGKGPKILYGNAERVFKECCCPARPQRGTRSARLQGRGGIGNRRAR